MKTSYIVLGVIALFVIIGISNFNSMVDKEEAVDSKWSEVENTYQRRADLIPNLVETVKGYAAHEKEALTAVIEARAKATSTNINVDNLNAASLKKFQAAQDGLSSALSRLMVVVERYPDLKANQNFLELQAQLEGTENRIAFARTKFTEEAQVYNAYIRKFPKNMLANVFGFDKKEYFKSTEGADVAPSVKF